MLSFNLQLTYPFLYKLFSDVWVELLVNFLVVTETSLPPSGGRWVQTAEKELSWRRG